MNIPLKIAFAEPSAVIRAGLEVLFHRLPGFRVRTVEIETAESLPEMLRRHRPDLLIMNPVWLCGNSWLYRLREETGCMQLKCMALLYALHEESLLRQYDERLSVFDGPQEIHRKLESLFRSDPSESPSGEQQALSLREREIVIAVVKGLTNREIADRLCLSAHTVITHRRNIARKLQIHSASGLTIYAIVNKLVELNEINQRP